MVVENRGDLLHSGFLFYIKIRKLSLPFQKKLAI